MPEEIPKYKPAGMSEEEYQTRLRIQSLDIRHSTKRMAELKKRYPAGIPRGAKDGIDIVQEVNNYEVWEGTDEEFIAKWEYTKPVILKIWARRFKKSWKSIQETVGTAQPLTSSITPHTTRTAKLESLWASGTY